MKSIKEYSITPLVLFLFLFLDGQLSNLFNNFFSIEWHATSHFLLIFMIFVSISLSKQYNLLLFFLIGLCYDVYYFHIIGIAVVLLPLLSLLVCSINTVMLMNRWTRLLSVVTLVFLFEIISFTLAHFLNLTTLPFSDFIVYDLVPTLVLNSLLLLIFQPLFEKFYL